MRTLCRMSSIHAVVFCWPGQADNTFNIARALRGQVERLTVIDASQAAVPEDLQVATDLEWLSVDTRWYYGSKFEHALKRFEGDVMLQIQADARSSNWPELVRRCRAAFAEQPDIGIWSPDVWFTLFPTDQVALFKVGDSERYVVAQSDCIVWALAKPVVERLRRFDYSNNNLGWGIDWAAISYCFANQMSVVRDKSHTIEHPRSRNYSSEEAREQMRTFTSQFSSAELVQYRLLEGFIANSNLGVKGQLAALAQATRRAIERRGK
jgi:hypothetical protein